MQNQSRGQHPCAKTSLLLWLAVGGITQRASAATYPTGYEITDRDAPGQLTLQLSNFITAPKTQNQGSSSQTASQVARINFVRQEPVPSLAAQRLFIDDLNGSIYTYNRSTGSFSTYLNMASVFSGSTGFDNSPGFAAGAVTLQFDPDYIHNGKFYTVHTEIGTNNSSGAFRDGVLDEWQDTNINDNTFEGTHAELLRVRYTGNIHPLGDISFDPTATGPGSPDWRNMYISSGDGSAGESTTASTRNQDQMLNNYLGKVLRMTPTENGTTGTYSIPTDNPFTNTTSVPGAKTEIYAYGFRNPHRMSWDVDPQTQAAHLFVDDIGLHSYEEVNLVKPGQNYGYSRIEGPQVLGNPSNVVTNDPLPSQLPIYTTTTSSNVGMITPTYPLTAYSHEDGDAITSGFVYRGTRIPELAGKYVFGDITTGRLFYCNVSDLLAADDGNPNTEATIHEFKVLFDSPYNGNGLMPERVFDIVRDEFDRRSETAVGTQLHNGLVDGDILPGQADATDPGVIDPYGVAYTGGRADIRWTLIDNELYLISKSDGMIRAVSAPLYGDANDDGLVNALDFNALSTHFGQTGQTWLHGDFNFDGIVNTLDFNTLASNFGHASPSDPALGGFVPEPATLMSFAFAALALAHRRRRH